MIHLITYNLRIKLRNFSMVFWPLVFPLILGTFFFFAFGNISEADFETVSVAVVKPETSNPLFLGFLNQIENNTDDLISVSEMPEQKALDALKSGKIAGIYYADIQPSLTVTTNGIPESILQTILDNYESSLTTVRKIFLRHPSGILKGLEQMMDTRELVQEVSLGGKTIDGNVQFFYALIAMACFYGCFIGFGSAIPLQANLSSLAARRTVTPTHKLKIVLSEQISAFFLGYLDVIILILYLRYVLRLDFQGNMAPMLLITFPGCLIGVSLGFFVGSLGRMREGVKTGILLAVSMTCCFLSGLMNNTMKDIVEKNIPVLNRLNPAALISDAFYCINVYNDPARYYRNLIILAVMSVLLTGASFFMIRRERYDSL